jgi:hypothetical protein
MQAAASTPGRSILAETIGPGNRLSAQATAAPPSLSARFHVQLPEKLQDSRSAKSSAFAIR